MANVILLSLFIVSSSLASSGEFAAYLTAGGESVSVVDSSGETVFSVAAVIPGY
ncbi:MAG: hypothetical protein KAH54_07670 [Candidatus Sabulitectum sp.]|nr:hypothetical protein [Candidatus Sabulitectum sp.]